MRKENLHPSQYIVSRWSHFLDVQNTMDSEQMSAQVGAIKSHYGQMRRCFGELLFPKILQFKILSQKCI